MNEATKATAATKLWRIKALHTAVWAFFFTAILAVLYSGIADDIRACTWIASGLVVVEGLVLVAFKSHCPLTLLARRYSNSTKDNFDIFLPEWLARHNKLIFSVLIPTEGEASYITDGQRQPYARFVVQALEYEPLRPF